MLFTSIFLCCFFSFTQGSGATWTYDDPAKWKDHYPNCGGKSQSPINIVVKETSCNETIASLLSYNSNYNKAASGNFTVTNNGHTCKVSTSVAQASITLNGITYNLAQFHFHWGSENSKGSEHQIDGASYPAELHLVHFNSKYPSFTTAVNKTDGLAVLGAFIKVGKENTALNHFLNLNVTTDGSSVDFKAFAVNDLLPTTKTSFYRYSGSLTRPTCDQTVTWTVFKNAIEMSQTQLDKFRALKTGNKSLVNNFRPVQGLNGRKVIASFEHDSCSSAGSFKTSFIFVLFTVLFHFSF